MKQYLFTFDAVSDMLNVEFQLIEKTFEDAKKKAVEISGVEFTGHNLKSCVETPPYTAIENEKEG